MVTMAPMTAIRQLMVLGNQGMVSLNVSSNGAIMEPMLPTTDANPTAFVLFIKKNYDFFALVIKLYFKFFKSDLCSGYVLLLVFIK